MTARVVDAWTVYIYSGVIPVAAKRTQFYLSHAQWDALEAEAHRGGVSAAEVIREAIDRYLATKPDFVATLRAVTGAWADTPADSEAYVRGLRSEWGRRPHA